MSETVRPVIFNYNHPDPANDDWLDVVDDGDALTFRESNMDGPSAAKLLRADVARLVIALSEWLHTSPREAASAAARLVAAAVKQIPAAAPNEVRVDLEDAAAALGNAVRVLGNLGQPLGSGGTATGNEH